MFRFTIRELVLLTLVVAMGVGWWLDRRTLRREIEDTQIDTIRKLRLERERNERPFPVEISGFPGSEGPFTGFGPAKP